jgi:hypothetical protein
MKTKFGIGTLILAMLLVSVVVPVASADVKSNLNVDTSESSVGYTAAELQDLYYRYNISENDIKFAKNELPNFLEGTILCSDKRVIVTEDGNPPKNMKQEVNFDVIISEQEMRNIIEEARKKHIEKYNVDPNNPRVDIVDGYALPEEEVTKLVESGKLSVKAEKPLTEFDTFLVSTGTFATTFTHVYRNPYQINNNIDVNIFIAKEDSSHHAPTESYYQDTVDALGRFGSYGITVNRIWHYNFWDASDVTPTEQSSSLLDDLEEDTTWVIESPNDIVIGWVNSMDNNGRAWRPGSFSVCAVKALGVDWPHDSIVQHEVSHNFDADDQNSLLHPECIMNYLYAQQGTNIWCTSCRNTVDYGIDH